MNKSNSDKSVLTDNLEMEAAYRAMAADADHEREAMEWCEGLIGDAIQED